MPYESVAQQKFMHAKHPEIAKRWDKETEFKGLPKKKGKRSAHSTRMESVFSSLTPKPSQ